MAEVESKVQGVLGPFAVLSNRDMVLANAHVQHFLATSVGSFAVQAAYTDVSMRILPVIAGAAQQANEPQIPLSVQAMNAETLVREVREDLLRGAHESALSRLRAWRGWSQQGLGVDEEADLLLLEADALGQTGMYREAIEVLGQFPVGSTRDVDAAVSLGEKHWRLGEQIVALRRYAQARQKAQAAGRQDAWMKAAIRTVAVRNEMRDGVPSVRLVLKLADYCSAQHAAIPDRDQCLVYRTAARTLALVPTRRSDAERYARLALEISLNRTRSVRDEGNSRYALGDVLRHSGRVDEANGEFEAAMRIAERTGNFDLKLYCLLAMAACAVKSGSLQQLNSRLKELREVCSDTESPEFRIVGLFSLANSRFRGDEVPFVDPASSVSGRPWTTRLLRVLTKPGDISFAIQGATIIL
jgi:tetratricopeptide (TPR) repeat protein